MRAIDNQGSGDIVRELAAVIVDNKAYLSEIDGKIGDGDHGVNMAKGFDRAASRIAGGSDTLHSAMRTLSDVLLLEIGGSMGPLYGTMFSDMADAIGGCDEIDAAAFSKMLHAGLDGVRGIGAAEVGDKTMLDCYVPAVAAFDAALAAGAAFPEALERMKAAAVTGRDSTIDLVAKVGRASRLGERSRGVLDAGATSCCLILAGLAEGVGRRLKP